MTNKISGFENDIRPVADRHIKEEMDRVYGENLAGAHGLRPSHRPPLGDNMVILPKHYSRFEIEPIRFTVANKLDMLEANAVKYILRAPYKHNDKGKQDYQKAIRSVIMKAKQMLGDPDWWKPYKTDIGATIEQELSYGA